jgi:hypothetical protein
VPLVGPVMGVGGCTDRRFEACPSTLPSRGRQTRGVVALAGADVAWLVIVVVFVFVAAVHADAQGQAAHPHPRHRAPDRVGDQPGAWAILILAPASYICGTESLRGSVAVGIHSVPSLKNVHPLKAVLCLSLLLSLLSVCVCLSVCLCVGEGLRWWQCEPCAWRPPAPASVVRFDLV